MLDNTRAALAIYDAEKPERDALWGNTESDADVFAAEAADKRALDLVRVAFHKDIASINSLESCMRVDEVFMRKMVVAENVERLLAPLNVGFWRAGVSSLGWTLRVDPVWSTRASINVRVNTALNQEYQKDIGARVRQTLTEAGYRQLPTGEYSN